MNPTRIPNNNDHQIDRVLNAIGTAAPPVGMDRRVLNILEAQSSQAGVIPSQSSRRQRVLRSVIPSEATKSRSRGIPVFHIPATKAGAPHMRSMCGITRMLPLRWISTAAIAALIVAAVFTSHHRSTGPAVTTHSTPAPTQPTTIATTVTEATPHRTAALAHIRLTQSQSTEAAEPAEDAQLSHPAPPIPLTDQERLLLHYTSRGRIEDLAQISNDSKAAKDQQDAAEFTAFFTPPPLPKMTGESE